MASRDFEQARAWNVKLQALRGSLDRGESEIKRITSVPLYTFPPQKHLEELNRDFVRRKPYEGLCNCAWCRERGNPKLRLLPDQLRGMAVFVQEGQGLFSIRVGGGKTALAQLMASWAYGKSARTILILIPPSVFEQFWKRDLIWARSHLKLQVPWFGLGNTPKAKRLRIASSGRPGAYVMPYSLLSTEDSIDLLHQIDADLVIADEAQYLRGQSAKTKRFWSWFQRRPKAPRLVAMSGTLTSKSTEDYHRLARGSLREKSPLPKHAVEATEWAAMLESGAERPSSSEVRQIYPLLEWAMKWDPRAEPTTYNSTTKGIRAAFKLRLHTTPGFLASEGKPLGTSLEIHNQPLPVPQKIQDLMHRVEKDWESPGGEILRHSIEIHEHLRQLSAGFWTQHYWDEDAPLVDQAKERWDLGQEYARELRSFFKAQRYPRRGQDTPMAVGKWHSENGAIGGQGHLYDLWREWHALDHEDLPERQSRPIWVDDYKLRAAVKWAKARGKGIIWCHHQAVQYRLIHLLGEAGIKPLWKGAGASWLYGDGSSDRVVVASISAHHEGKNLQDHKSQLLLQWPRPSKTAEQLLGRLHRHGQQADRLVVDCLASTEFDHEQVAATLLDTVYVTETMGGRMKLLIADWSPLPRKFSSEHLRAKGYRLEGGA